MMWFGGMKYFLVSINFFSVLQAPVHNLKAEVDFGLVNNFCKHRLVNVLRGRPRNGFRGCVSTGTAYYLLSRTRNQFRTPLFFLGIYSPKKYKI